MAIEVKRGMAAIPERMKLAGQKKSEERHILSCAKWLVELPPEKEQRRQELIEQIGEHFDRIEEIDRERKEIVV